ncbi:probable lipid-A-disaccharide synthase, mitochondrial isoform X4 [Lathyrus oleraceus]|uniref:probable lipid-A-disaccharide synthase, mitochondrial isoform X4 n=1 Tax=Pisum sativum TaxID=3888 RepID=UPI0021D037C1|nr:probable lipid-A-disaccharide synthase, mitochondrial isoform X4 [Pisum sativum]
MFGAKALILLTRKWKLKPPNTVLSFSSSSQHVKFKAPMDMAAIDGELRVFLVAGEVSGDSIASRLMASLKLLSPFPVRFSGIGGSKMRSEGLQSLFPIEDISVMGIWELLPHLYTFKERLNEAVKAASLFEPHVVLTVDSKGFSFRFLKQLRARQSQQKLHSPAHFHYVAPSFWAWKGGEERLGGLAEFVDHLLCILPNEDKVCRLNGLSATFVGHPVLEDIMELNLMNSPSINECKAEGNGKDFRRKHEVPPGATVISLLPGSRVQEVSRMLPIFANTMELLKDNVPQLMTIIHVAPNEHVENFIAGAVHRWPVPVVLIPGGTTHMRYDAFSASKVALCTSGTVAVELQLARLPCVVAYRAHILTEWFIRYNAKIQYMSLPNILLNSAIVPEALFQSCELANLALLLKDLIHDHVCREKQILSAQTFVKLLMPSERINQNLAKQSLTGKCPDYSPSAVAALTILNHGKPVIHD